MHSPIVSLFRLAARRRSNKIDVNVFGTTLGKSINLKINGAERFFLDFGSAWLLLLLLLLGSCVDGPNVSLT